MCFAVGALQAKKKANKPNSKERERLKRQQEARTAKEVMSSKRDRKGSHMELQRQVMFDIDASWVSF